MVEAVVVVVLSVVVDVLVVEVVLDVVVIGGVVVLVVEGRVVGLVVGTLDFVVCLVPIKTFGILLF